MFVNYSKDWPLILVGILLMGGSAIATPMNTYIYGEIMGKLSQFYLQDQSNHSFSQDIVKLCVGLIGIGCCKMILVWLGMFTWLKFVKSNNQEQECKFTIKLLTSHNHGMIQSKT